MVNIREVYVYGAGGHGKSVAAVLLAAGMRVRGFLDDDPSKTGRRILNIPVAGNFAFLAAQSKTSLPVIAAVGDNALRKKIFEKLKGLNIPLATAVHPDSICHESARLGEGTVLMAGVIVHVDAAVGQNVILNTGVCVDHDCVIESHAHLAPGVILAGGVRVGEGAFLGVGARVVPGIKIGAGAVVGAGSVVLEDVTDGAKVAGVPAKPIPKPALTGKRALTRAVYPGVEP